MTIDEAYKIVSYLVDKYQGTYIAPDDFNMMINMAQDQYIESIVDGTGNINSNNRKSPAGLMVNSSVSDRLSNFYTELSLAVSTTPGATLGTAPKPESMWTATSLRTSANRPIKKVFDDNLATHLTNPIDAPTVSDPIYMEAGSNFKFFPTNVVAPTLGYIRNPNKMRWAYTGDLVYSENTNIATTASGTNWALATGAVDLGTGGYTHTVGSVVALQNTSTTAVIGTYYNITLTLSSTTAGSVVLNFGGLTGTASANGTITIAGTATSTSALSIVPTSTFNGTVVAQVRVPSIQPEWADTDMNEIIYIAIGLIGINLKDVDLIRASQTIKNEGQ
jgi:hypothetical protein